MKPNYYFPMIAAIFCVAVSVLFVSCAREGAISYTTSDMTFPSVIERTPSTYSPDDISAVPSDASTDATVTSASSSDEQGHETLPPASSPPVLFYEGYGDYESYKELNDSFYATLFCFPSTVPVTGNATYGFDSEEDWDAFLEDCNDIVPTDGDIFAYDKYAGKLTYKHGSVTNICDTPETLYSYSIQSPLFDEHLTYKIGDIYYDMSTMDAYIVVESSYGHDVREYAPGIGEKIKEASRSTRLCMFVHFRPDLPVNFIILVVK